MAGTLLTCLQWARGLVLQAKMERDKLKKTSTSAMYVMGFVDLLAQDLP